MSKKSRKIKEEGENSCFICKKTPAFYQKGYMGGKYLCQTHAVKHLKYVRLLMVTTILVICFLVFKPNFTSKAENTNKKEHKTSKSKKVQQKTKVITSIHKN